MNLEQVGSADEVSVQELKTLWAAKPDLVVLDCREDNERQTASILGSIHIPMQQIPGRVAELDGIREMVVFCHHGMRSLRVTEWLRQQAGFGAVKSLRGGIDAWSHAIDPGVPRY